MTVDRVWYILGKKLNDEASDEELKELAEILSVHPELHYPIQSISDLWKLDKQNDKQNAIDALQMHLLRLADNRGDINTSDSIKKYSRISGKLSHKSRYIFYVLAAVVLMAIFIYFIPFGKIQSQTTATAKASTDNKINEISTKIGSHSKVVLPDGSTVWLNGGSRITYDKTFNQSIREVALTGEAYFDVTRNVEKPFIIHTRQMDIKVLGTAFNVKAYPEDNSSEASLIHGAIEVTIRQGSGEKIILKPNDKLTVHETSGNLKEGAVKASTVNATKISSISYLPTDSTIIETSWVDNRLIFRDKPFVELSVDLERKYGIAFVFEDEEVKRKMFDGNFKNENIEQALKALQLANNFSYKFINDTVIIAQ